MRRSYAPAPRSLLAGIALVLAIVVLAWVGPALSGHDVEQMDLANRLAGPSSAHWLGTDNFGRDLWIRMAQGARVSLGIGLVSVSVAALMGTLCGLTAGYYGGAVDLALMRVVDLFQGFPPMILVLGLVAALGPGASNVTVALAAVFWTHYARVVRAVTQSERTRDFVTAARALGVPSERILVRHVLPGALAPVLVLATLGIGAAIVAESGLSFLGLGVQPPTPTWGWTLAYGMRYLRTDVWLSTVPGVFIMLTVLGFNLVGEGLREVLEPRAASRSR